MRARKWVPTIVAEIDDCHERTKMPTAGLDARMARLLNGKKAAEPRGSTRSALRFVRRVAPAIVAALLLAGCVQPYQQPQYQVIWNPATGSYVAVPQGAVWTPPPVYYRTPAPAPSPNYSGNSPGNDAALRAAAEGLAAERAQWRATHPPQTVSSPAPPDDAPASSSCGWWRLSNLWC